MTVAIINRQNLESVLKYIRPRNLNFYQEVFIHKSALKMLNKSLIMNREDNLAPMGYVNSNERLEFLGDVVLSIAVTDFLYDKYPDENEGFLTKMRIKIVKGITLAMFARQLGIEKFLSISNSTLINNNILENAFEALVGAIYLDYKVIGQEMHFVKKFVFGLLKDYIDWNEIIKDDNYKDILMRYMQKTRSTVPEYTVLDTKGLAHCPHYTVQLKMLNDAGEELLAVSEASTKRDAEQLCAKTMLEKLSPSNIFLLGHSL